MSVVYLFKVQGVDKEKYYAAIDSLEKQGANAPEGRLYHVAGEMGNELRVVDVWESEEAFNKFLQENLGQAMQEAGMPQPQIESWSVINIIKGE